jgi:hypothetical protein
LRKHEFEQRFDLRFHNAEEEVMPKIKEWTTRDKERISLELTNFQLFLDPHLRVHVVNLLCYLDDARFHIDNRGKYFSEEWFVKRMSTTFLAIVKEIAEIDRVEGGVYQEKCPQDEAEKWWFE